jgi:hypothetical protein
VALQTHQWHDDKVIDYLIRAPVAPLKISDAAMLAQLRISFLASLVPLSAAAAVLAESVQFSFDHAASISVPSVSLPTAGWVGENLAIPVLQGATSAVTLTPAKLAAILVITREMVEGGNAEAVMRQVLVENISASLDSVFFTNAAAVAGVSCAGILNGATVVPPATGGGSAALIKDVAALAAATASVAGSGRMVLVASAPQAAAIRATLIDAPPVYSSTALPAGTVVGLVPASIAAAVSTPNISASLQTTVHLASPAQDLVISPSTVSAPQKSMFQTDSLALRYTQELAWVRRGQGVATISGATWP